MHLTASCSLLQVVTRPCGYGTPLPVPGRPSRPAALEPSTHLRSLPTARCQLPAGITAPYNSGTRPLGRNGARSPGTATATHARRLTGRPAPRYCGHRRDHKTLGHSYAPRADDADRSSHRRPPTAISSTSTPRSAYRPVARRRSSPCRTRCSDIEAGTVVRPRCLSSAWSGEIGPAETGEAACGGRNPGPAGPRRRAVRGVGHGRRSRG